jgi:hypothetical protein
MITEQLWNDGLSLTDYINKMKVYQKEMIQRVDNIRITSAEFQRLKSMDIIRKLLILVEPSCKDCLMNLPIIAKIVEAVPGLSMKIFIRSENPELTNFFLNEGIENIPVCWVMKEDFSSCGHWIEQPQSANRKINEWKSENPLYQSIKNDQTISEEDRAIRLKPWSEKLVDEMWNWYDTSLQSDTVREIQLLLNC